MTAERMHHLAGLHAPRARSECTIPPSVFNAVPFYNSGTAKKYIIKISAVAVVDMIRKMTNWNAEDIWNVPGVYFAEDEALVYDLNTATAPTPKLTTGKVGRPRKNATEEVGSPAL